jgi:hypothetical protein
MGVRYWSFGKTVFQELLSYIDDEDYGDITDALSGRDVTIEYTPQEKSDTNFAKTKVKMKPKQTPLSEDEDQAQLWLTEQPVFNTLFKTHTYEELRSFLENHLDPEGATAGPSSVTTETIKPAEPADTKPDTKVTESLEEFDEMFGKET